MILQEFTQCWKCNADWMMSFSAERTSFLISNFPENLIVASLIASSLARMLVSWSGRRHWFLLRYSLFVVHSSSSWCGLLSSRSPCLLVFIFYFFKMTLWNKGNTRHEPTLFKGLCVSLLLADNIYDWLAFKSCNKNSVVLKRKDWSKFDTI